MEDADSLPAASRPQAFVAGKTLFEKTVDARQALTAPMLAEMNDANTRYALTESFLDKLETDASLHDADKLAFREVVDSLQDHLRERAPANPKGRAVQLRLAEDDKALGEIRGLYEKEVSRIFARFETRGMTVHREAWEAYVASLKKSYSAAGILRDSGITIEEPPMAATPAGPSTLPDKTLVLTFDDGPHPKYTAQILDILARYKVKGVFFEVGRNLGAESNGKMTFTKASAQSLEILKAGHLLGNHTNTHAFLPKLDSAHVDDEIDRTTRMLTAVDNVTPDLFRPPYGALSSTVRSEVAARKLRTMLWNIDSLDWEDPISTSVANRVIKEARHAGKGIILFHDIHPRAVEALPTILDTLSADGFHFVLWDGRTVLDGGPAIPAKAPEPQRAPSKLYRESWAVVIGINDYQKWPKLSYAVNDAQAMRDVLINKYQFPADHVTTLLDGQATRQAILSALGDTLTDSKRVQKEDRVFVFFAGHGTTRRLPSGRSLGYVIPVDADEMNLQSQAISMTNFQDIDDATPAKHVFYAMDACYSGLAVVRGDTAKFLEAITSRAAREMLTAGGADEQVADGGPQGHSIFTWTLLQGMDGRADLNGDGYITASELAAYVAPAVSSVSHQTPVFGNLVGSEGGDFVFELRHDDEFLSDQSKQLDAAAISLNRQLDEVHKAIAEKRARNEALAKNLSQAKAELASLDSRGLNDQGMKLYRERRYDEALKTFQQAFAQQPSSALIANNAGYTLLKLGRFEEALTWCNKALAIDPNRAIAWSNLGEVYIALGRKQEAIQACEKFLAMAPNHPGAASVREKLARLR